MKSNIVNIDLENNHYTIYINNETFDFDAIKTLLTHRKIAIISNETVAPLYLESIVSSLKSYNTDIYTFILADGEQYKNQKSWSAILDFLAENQFNRSDLLISLGGGVICDMTGFAAASWMRGIDFIQIPTSLLAQVDASVGGKTGINHPKGKNLIGAFHQPKAVIINTSTLRTLANKEIKSGLGEAIKYGFINQPHFIGWMVTHAQAINSLDLYVMTELISKCCQFKAEIVQQDEKETGIRALLNLGHTFAHAIETMTNYSEYSHGEAVSIGIVMAASLSENLKISESSFTKKIEHNMQLFNLQNSIPKEMNPSELIRIMRLDKKVINNKHRIILMKSIGQAYIQENVSEQDILEAIISCQN
jgi:3-dehydroquinate synthase